MPDSTQARVSPTLGGTGCNGAAHDCHRRRTAQMKILLVSGSRIIGGAERASLQLATGLVDRGHDVEVLCPAQGEWYGALSAAGIRTHPAAIGGALNLLTPFLIARHINRVRPDLLMVTTSDEWVWSCLTPRQARNPRLVLVRHMGLPLPFRVRWLAGRRSDAIVAVSRSVRDSLLIDSAIAPALVDVIPNAVRFAIAPRRSRTEDRARARNSLGLPPAGRLIAIFGRSQSRQGHRRCDGGRTPCRPEPGRREIAGLREKGRAA